jgi:hypothetical protein
MPAAQRGSGSCDREGICEGTFRGLSKVAQTFLGGPSRSEIQIHKGTTTALSARPEMAGFRYRFLAWRGDAAVKGPWKEPRQPHFALLRLYQLWGP